MHRCDVRKAFRRLKQNGVGCAALLLLEDFGTPHTHIMNILSFWCVGGVLLSHNPTIAVPSAQSNLATGIGTGPGVPLTLKPPTQTHETTTPHTPTRAQGQCVVSNTVQQTQTQQQYSSFSRQPCSQQHNTFLSPTRNRCFLCRCISTSHLQHVTMLTALAYQPHHLQGTSTETSSQNRLPA